MLYNKEEGTKGKTPKVIVYTIRLYEIREEIPKTN